MGQPPADSGYNMFSLWDATTTILLLPLFMLANSYKLFLLLAVLLLLLQLEYTSIYIYHTKYITIDFFVAGESPGYGPMSNPKWRPTGARLL